MNGDILEYIYDRLGPFDWPLIGRIRCTTRRFARRAHPPLVVDKKALIVRDSVRHVDALGEVYFHIETRVLHRVGGPAHIRGHCQQWYINGVRHREDGPAVIDSEKQVWYRNGFRHREDGPACIYISGYCEWRYEGRLHREEGPATYGCGTHAWYLHGIIQRHEDATETWIYDKGRLRKRITKTRTEWFRNGKLHRDGKPAVIYSDGTREWWVGGLPHRKGGPAVERPNGKHEWWRGGKNVTRY